MTKTMSSTILSFCVVNEWSIHLKKVYVESSNRRAHRRNYNSLDIFLISLELSRGLTEGINAASWSLSYLSF